jgi:hypothetical protein
MREVKSPSSRERGDFHPCLAESPGSRSSPSNARSDGGHLVRSPGKGGPASVRRDAVSGAAWDGVTPTARPVVGGQRDRAIRGSDRVIIDHDITSVCVTSGFVVG